MTTEWHKCKFLTNRKALSERECIVHTCDDDLTLALLHIHHIRFTLFNFKLKVTHQFIPKFDYSTRVFPRDHSLCFFLGLIECVDFRQNEIRYFLWNCESPVSHCGNGQFVIFTNENRRSKLKITVSIALGTLEMVDDNS